MVESQVAPGGLRARRTSAATSPPQVLATEERVNAMEVEIDRDLSTIIARRQPTARDLRLLIAISKTIADLERVGDEAARIARTVQRLINAGVSSRAAPAGDRPALRGRAGHRASCARRSTRSRGSTSSAARRGAEEDDQIDQEFDGLMRKLITYMMEDPRTISASIDLVFVAKAIERIGDHAKNIAEQIIYIVKGTDVRHNSIGTVESTGALSDARSTMSRILVVEDEPAIAELIAVNLRHAGFEVPIGRRRRAGAARGRRACCPTWCCSTGCCRARSAWRWRGSWRGEARTRDAADHHADRARRRGRQGRRASTPAPTTT